MDERTSLGMETITLTHRYPLCHEVESFEEDGSTSSRDNEDGEGWKGGAS
jgi:hypothetical protein